MAFSINICRSPCDSSFFAVERQAFRQFTDKSQRDGFRAFDFQICAIRFAVLPSLNFESPIFGGVPVTFRVYV